ncbi:hypothetical protein PCN061_1606 [Escherichia coli PCN061]|nr:hypothetical protein PCN061_1606 [Escherichia coli PCN061]
MKPDIYYGTVLKTCRDFDIILVNNFIDRVTVTVDLPLYFQTPVIT